MAGKKTATPIIAEKEELEKDEEITQEVSVSSSATETTLEINNDNLNEAMNAFADQLFKVGSKSLASMMRLPITSWKEDGLLFTVLSQQKKQIESVKKELSVFIRERFSLKSVTLNYEIVATPVHEAKPFTSRQKLEAMIKSNPEIIDFIEKFQLDLED